MVTICVSSKICARGNCAILQNYAYMVISIPLSSFVELDLFQICCICLHCKQLTLLANFCRMCRLALPRCDDVKRAFSCADVSRYLAHHHANIVT